MTNSVPSKLHDYDVISVIGSGSCGTCFKVKNRATGDIFVWKAIDYNSVHNEGQAETIVTEINLLRDLRHPNIVRYYDHIINEETKTLYIIMECCEGGDLRKWIEKCRAEESLFQESFIWKVLYQMSKALQGCHSRNAKISVLHRDIKPANVFLDESGNVKLGDFGLARVLYGRNSFAETIVGTPYYMSPELIKGNKYNRKSDIWSLGCLIYEMCALHPPFMGKQIDHLYENISGGNFKPIPQVYSNDLQNIIQFMLSVDHGYRPTIEVILHHPIVVANVRQNVGPPKLIPKSQELYPQAKMSSTAINNLALKSTPELRTEIFGNSIARRKIFNSENDVGCVDDQIDKASTTNPDEITQDIFNTALKQRLHAIRAKESVLKLKEDELKEKERELLKRERRISQKFDRKKLPTRRPLNSIMNDSATTIEPNDSIVAPTVAKFDPNLIPKPKGFRSQRVSFKSPPKRTNIENIPPHHPYNARYTLQDLENAVNKNFTALTIVEAKKPHNKRRSFFSLFHLNQKSTATSTRKMDQQSNSSKASGTSYGVSTVDLTNKWNQATKKTAFEMLAILNQNENGGKNNGSDIFMVDDKIVRRDRRRKSMVVYRQNTVL